MNDRVQHFFRSCELFCVKDCCGIAAFDFRPVIIAAHLIADTGNENAPEKAEALLAGLRADFDGIREVGPDESGFYQIDEIADGLMQDELTNFEAELVHNVSVALQLIEIDSNSTFEPATFDIYTERRNEQARKIGSEQGDAGKPDPAVS